MFKKKEDLSFDMDKPPVDLGLQRGKDLGLGKERDKGLGVEPEPGFVSGIAPSSEMPGAPSFSQPSQPQPAHQALAQAQQAIQPQLEVQKDIQIINAKIDSLKAILDNINQRLANIERIANESQKEYTY